MKYQVGIICKEGEYGLVDALLVSPLFAVHRIKTNYDAWIDMKENAYSAFVFYFDDWKESYENLIELVKTSLPTVAVAIVSNKIPEPTARRLLEIPAVGVFHFDRDAKTLSGGLEKLIKGQAVHYRKEERFRAYPLVELECSSTGYKKTHRLVNLSVSGAEISGSVTGLKEGDLLSLSFTTLNQERKTFHGNLKWIQNQAGQDSSFGVEFRKD